MCFLIDLQVAISDHVPQDAVQDGVVRRGEVLGEVARPAVLNIPNARISLLEAIGMAGDMTIFGKRDNVLLIREENKKKIAVRINLNSTDLLTSPYYYLKSNDIVYVEPNTAKVSSATKAQNLAPIIFSALSFAVITLDILTR